MYFPFECKDCRKDKWTIRYDSEDKVHLLSCANCGAMEILEEIFGSRRKKENAKKKDYRKRITEQTKTKTEPIKTSKGDG